MTSTKLLASTVHMLLPHSPHPSSVQLNCIAHSPSTACTQNCSDLTYTTPIQQPRPHSRTFQVTLLHAGSKQLQCCAYAAHSGTGLFCPQAAPAQLLHRQQSCMQLPRCHALTLCHCRQLPRSALQPPRHSSTAAT